MIRDFYQDRTLLVTGGTGFLGQALVAKVLRDLPGVRRILVLIRPRRLVDGRLIPAAQRLEEELLGSSVLSGFRAADPRGFAAARVKVEAVSGDVTLPGLGLETQVREQLLGEVDLIVNSAATVVFDEPLDLSLRLNALGPLSLLEFAHRCRRPVVFVHVSTAYVNGQLPGRIGEELLPPDRTIRQLMEGLTSGPAFDPEAEVADCQRYCRAMDAEAASPRRREGWKREILKQSRSRSLSEARLEQLVEDRSRRWRERALVEEGMRRGKAYGWNDVYTFTKALGERLLVRRREGVPLVIVRPSIIESSLQDPEPGWITGLKVADPLIAAYGRGLLPNFPARPEMVIDMIPVDLVVNATLAAPTQASAGEVRIFQVASSADNPVRLSTVVNHVHGYFLRQPLRDREGRAPQLPRWTYPSLRRFHLVFKLKYLWPVRAKEWVLDHLPASWAPQAQKRLTANLRLRLKRLLYYTDIYHPYTNLGCYFEAGRTRQLFESLPSEEQGLFGMDSRRIDWEEYLQRIHLPGLRKHVLREESGDEALFREAPEEAGVEEERWRAEGQLRTVPDLLRWAAGRYAGRVALQLRREGRWDRLSYRELLLRVEAQARRWQGQGLGPGQRVVLCAPNGPEWVVGYLAASTLGLSVVPLDPQTRPAELWALARFAQARAVIAVAPVWKGLAEGQIDGIPGLDLEQGGAPFGSAPAALPSGPWSPPEVDPEAPASILFTTGTAVAPRGVMLSHRSLIADLLSLAEVQRLYETDQMLSLLPLHHGLEFTGGLLMSLWAGATTTYLEHLNSREILNTLRATHTTAILTVPRLLKILADRVLRLEEGEGAGSLRSLRLVVCGGAPLEPELFDLYEQRLGLTIHEGYGLTEAGPIVSVNPPGRARRGSVGQVLPGVEVDIADPDGKGEGQLLVRGPNLMSGYLDQPDLSAEVLRESWLHTGDLGRLDAEGYLYLTGRSKDLIVTGAGKNVYPEEVEALYRELPHVAELGVVGVRSARTLSEEVHGVAVLEIGSAGPAEEAIKQRAYQIAAGLPSYQRLQRLHLCRRPLPRREDGEIDRGALAAQLQGERLQVSERVDLPPWERQLYRQLSRLTGLTTGEVIAHLQVPLDALIDSLMAVELSALLEGWAGKPMEGVVRPHRTLGEVVELLRPDLESRDWQEEETPPFWTRVVGQAGAPPGPGASLLQGLFWLSVGPLLRRYLSLDCQGLEHLPQAGPYLIAANHLSHLDAPCLLLALKGRASGLSLAVPRGFGAQAGSWARLSHALLNAVPVDRREGFVNSLGRLRQALGPRRPLLVFPEGSRSIGGRLQPFKTGIGLLAFELGAPVVPVHIRGTYEALPKGNHRPQRQPVRLRFGPPLEIAPYAARRGALGSYEVYREIAEELHRRIEALGANP
ncbi:MAG: AMP-binding protein [Candidatus Handelsmanbacteria bacterium]|nr:AMP-binding protein [Candidatus Handelsmanbacteria bacterium]